MCVCVWGGGGGGGHGMKSFTCGFLQCTHLHLQTGSSKYITMVTPTDPKRRGAQLSIQFSFPVTDIHKFLHRRGVMVSRVVGPKSYHNVMTIQ